MKRRGQSYLAAVASCRKDRLVNTLPANEDRRCIGNKTLNHSDIRRHLAAYSATALKVITIICTSPTTSIVLIFTDTKTPYNKIINAGNIDANRRTVQCHTSSG